MRALPCWLATGALLGGAAGAARADDERALSVTASYAAFSTVGVNEDPSLPGPALTSDRGAGLTLAYERMLGTDFGLRAELTGGVFHGGAQMDQSTTSYAGVADVALVARLDILKYVPYGFAGVGGVATRGGPLPGGADLVLVLGGGVDDLLSRSRSLGLEVRVASFAGDVTVVTAGVRGTLRWGFF